jgi:hypothetical protein
VSYNKQLKLNVLYLIDYMGKVVSDLVSSSGVNIDHIKNDPLNIESVRAFLENLIDYAGIFPPANLPLEDAITNYSTYIRENDSWIIGLFVIPSLSLEKLEQYVSLFDEQFPLTLSVLGRKSNDLDNYMTNLVNDLKNVSSFRERHGKKVKVEVFEFPLLPIVPKLKELEEISTLMLEYNLKPYCEFTILLDHKNWNKLLLDTLDVVAEHNRINKQSVGMKLRTGGIKANMFPTPEQVATFITGCRDRKIYFKFTAGLHHPIRMYRSEVNTKMHGFLNVFFASILAYNHHLDKTTVIDILSDEQPSNFSFYSKGLAWKEYRVTNNEIRILRTCFLNSYGCCSFDEPRNELRELNVFKEGAC